MIRDAENDYLFGTLVTVTAISNVVDLGSAVDVSRGQPKREQMHVRTAFTAAGAATLTPALVEADSADLATNQVVIWQGPAIPKATLVAGYWIYDRPMAPATKRYRGWTLTVATGPFLTGALTSGIVSDTETPQTVRPVGNTGL